LETSFSERRSNVVSKCRFQASFERRFQAAFSSGVFKRRFQAAFSSGVSKRRFQAAFPSVV
jgi:hypothetical protein